MSFKQGEQFPIKKGTWMKQESTTKPTQEQLDGYKIRAAGIRARLERAGFQPSKGFTTGTKLVKYFVRTAGVESPKEMTVSQWESVFSGLDTLMKDPKKAVTTIDDVCGIRPPARPATEAEIEAANKRCEARPDAQNKIETITRAWIAKSIDPSATPEEREHAKKLVKEYGLGSTRIQ